MPKKRKRGGRQEFPSPSQSPKMTKEERVRQVVAWQRQYYATHPDKLEERRVKMRAYEKARRQRMKFEKAMAAFEPAMA